jgi:hypothetical protein
MAKGQSGDTRIKNVKNLREFITFSGLNNVIKNQDITIVGGLENKNVLELGLFNVKDFFNLE